MTRRLILDLQRVRAPGQALGFSLDHSYLASWGAGRQISFRLPPALGSPARSRQEQAQQGLWLAEALKDWHREQVLEGDDGPLCLRTSAVELSRLPWSRIPGADGVEIGAHPSFFLQLCLPGVRPAPDPEPGGSALLLWSAAGGAVPIAAQTRLLRSFVPGFDPALHSLCDPDPATLEARVTRQRPRLLFLLCHGDASSEQDHGLHLGGRLWTGQDLAACLRHAPPALVVLLCCHGAEAGPEGDYLGSAAFALHQAGLPLVLACPRALAVTQANLLTEGLLRALFEQQSSLEEALSQVRSGLRELELLLYGAPSPEGGHRPWTFRPYRGLLPLERGDQLWGRDGELVRLKAGIESASAADAIFVLVGSSGSGKSSLVRAGLAHHYAESCFHRWSPASKPWSDCCLALFGVTLLPGEQTDALFRDTTSILVVDSLDEALLDLGDGAAPAALLEQLERASERMPLLLLFRVDRLAELGHWKLRGESLERRAFDPLRGMFLGELEDLRPVILGPAQALGLQVEPSLVQQLLVDSAVLQPKLPLLQLALDQLWQHREQRRMSLAAYAMLGGLSGMLSRVAENMLSALDEAEQQQARRTLPRLVRMEEGRPLGRLVLPRATLCPPDHGGAAAFERMVERAVSSRILVEQPTGLALAHDALLSHCAPLRRWLQEDSLRLQQLQWAEQEAATWRAHGQEEGFAPRGARLARLEGVGEAWVGELPAEVQAFLDAGRQLREREAAEKEEQIRRLSAALAERDAALGEAQQALAVFAASSLPHAPTLAALHLRTVTIPPSDGWMLQALRLCNLPLASYCRPFRPLSGLESSARPSLGICLEGQGRELVWQRPTGPEMLSRPAGARLCAACLSPDGRQVATAWSDGTLRLHPVRPGSPVEQLPGTPTAMLWLTEGTFVIGDTEGTVWYWEARNPPKALWRALGAVEQVVASASGRVLASRHAGGAIRMGGGPHERQAPEGVQLPTPCLDLTLSEDGRRLALLDAEGAIWVKEEGQPVQAHRSSERGRCLAWQGDQLVLGTGDGQVIEVPSFGASRRWPVSSAPIWDVGTDRGEIWVATEAPSLMRLTLQPAGRRTLGDPAEPILGLSASTQGQWCTVHRRGIVRLHGKLVPELSATTLALFHPDRPELLATADRFGVQLWQMAAGRLRLCYRDAWPGVTALWWAGDRVLAGNLSGEVSAWSIEGRPLWRLPCGKMSLLGLYPDVSGRRAVVWPTADAPTIVDLHTGEARRCLPETARAVAWEEEALLVGYEDGGLREWFGGEVLVRVADPIRELHVRRRGVLLLTEGPELILRERDGAMRWRCSLEEMPESIVVSSDGGWVAVRTRGAVQLHRIGAPDPRGISVATEGVTELCFDPAGDWLGMGRHSGELSLLPVGAGPLRLCLEQVDGSLSAEEGRIYGNR